MILVARLPELFEGEPEPDVTISGMPVGASFDFSHLAMIVDADGECYVRPLETPVPYRWFTVRRDQDGYHVVVRLKNLKWTREPVSQDEKAKLLPVKSVTAEGG